MATNSYTKLHRAVRSGQLAEAHDVFKDIMQQKVANRLAEEKKKLMEAACPDCGKTLIGGYMPCKSCGSTKGMGPAPRDVKEESTPVCTKCRHPRSEHDGEEGCQHEKCRCMESF